MSILTGAGTQGHTKCPVLGVPMSLLDVNRVVSLTAEAAQAAGGYVTVCNAHSLVTAGHDSEHREALVHAIANTADGMPVVWVMRMMGHWSATRVHGRAVMETILASASRGLARHYLVGSSDEVQVRLMALVARQFRGAEVVGRWVPPASGAVPDLPDDVRDGIRIARADVVWVALGCPRQEKWMARHWRALAPAVLVGVGAAFDFLAERKPVAPEWMQRWGLEWLFRVLTEPRRLVWRYMATNPIFIWRAGRQLIGMYMANRVGSPSTHVRNTGGD